MLIRKIHIKRFGCFQDFATELRPGLNIIRGPNESGKSTLHQALLMALMAQPTQNQKTTPWRNWDSDRWYQLQLELADLDGAIYRISKDFGSASQVVYLPNGEIVRGRDKVDQTLGAIVGTTSMVIVQSTLCVEQDTLADLANGQKEISHSLETVLTGSEDHIFTNQALKRLDSHIKEFKKGFGRWAAQPGPLAIARDEVTRLQQRVQEIQAGMSGRANDERELAELEARLMAIEQELQPLRITREQVARYQKAQEELSHWQTQEDALDRKIEQVQAAQKELDLAQLELASMGTLASLSGNDKQVIDQLAGRVQTLREEYARHKDSISGYETELASYRERQATHQQARAEYDTELAAYNREQQEYQQRSSAYHAAQQDYEWRSRDYEQWLAGQREPGEGSQAGWLWLILIVAGGMAAAAGLFLGYWGQSPVLGIGGPAVGLPLIVAGVWLRRRPADTEQMPVEFGEAVSQPDRKERPLPPVNPLPLPPARQRPEPPEPLPAPPSKPHYDEATLRAGENQLQQTLSALGCDTINELNDRYALVAEWRRQMEKAQAQIDTLLSETTRDVLEQQRREASRRRRDVQEILQDPTLRRVSAMSVVEINGLESNCQKLESEQSELENKHQRLSIKLEQHQVSKEDLYQAEEMLEPANRSYGQAQERLAVLELTNEVLSAARETTLKQAQERLGPTTGKYLRLLTNQRYETAWIDANLNIQLQDPAQPDRRIAPDRLSRGARDQLYMAARLALVDMLFPKTRPPILLDDPFVHFDPTRLAAAIKMCCDIAEERQVLLFTCSDSYNHVGHHIVMPAAQSSA